MKIKRLLIGLLACSAMVACTNEDVIENNGQGNAQDANTAYVSVKLVMASEGGSRATTDGGYVTGTEAEQKIDGEKSIFLFYDAQGKWVTSGTVTTSTPNKENNGTDHEDEVNDLSDAAYIVLSGPDQELKKSTQILTVVNYHDVNSLKLLDLSEALAIVTDSDKNPANAGFLMSTSVYYNNGIVTTTAIDAEKNICDTQAKAKANPVKIYIERASAKVETKFNATYEVLGNGESTEKEDLVVNGVKQEAQIKINGWKLNAINETTNLVKKIDAAWNTTAPFEGWNWSDNFRSYWAMSTNWNMKYTGTENGLTYFTYAQTTGASEVAEYCYEQTVAEQLTGVGENVITYPNQTTILIAAEIQLKDGQQWKTAGNLYKYNGVYYTEDNYKSLILKQLKGVYYTQTTVTEGETTTTTTADLTADDITLAIATDGSLAGVKFTVTLNSTVYDKAGTEATADAIATYINGLAYVTEVEGYANGKCYYHIPIEHLSSVDGDPFYGVVRNHYYMLSISAVKHIGSAIYNPGKEIVVIPAEETTFYLAAELHVLSWHVVEQDVELN